MPTYEYQCEKCHKTFELFQSMKDQPLEVCPKERCQAETWGQGKVKRLLGTGAGLIFKGSGFYITDYRSSGYKEAAKKDSSSSSSSSSAGSSSSSSSSSSGSSGSSTSSPKPESK